MTHFLKNTVSAALCLSLLLAGTSLVSCGKEGEKGKETGTGTGTGTAFSEEDYLRYTIAGAESAYPDMGAVITFTDSAGKEYPVTYDELRYHQLVYKNYYDGGDDTYWTTNPDMEIRIREAYMDSIKRNHAVLAACEKYGVLLTAEEQSDLDHQIAEYISQFGSREIFHDALTANYMTEYFFNYNSALDWLYENLQYYYLESKMILQDETELREMMNTDDLVRCKHILIKNDDGEDPEANRALAEEILEKVKNGDDFDALVAEYCEDPGMEGNTDGYYFFRGEMDKAFEETSFALKDGEYSGIVESAYGYHIILRCEKENTYIDEHFNEIKSSYNQVRFYQLIDAECADWTMKTCADFDTINTWDYAKTAGGRIEG